MDGCLSLVEQFFLLLEALTEHFLDVLRIFDQLFDVFLLVRVTDFAVVAHGLRGNVFWLLFRQFNRLDHVCIWIVAFNRVRDPLGRRFGGRHHCIGDEADVVEFRDMVVIITERIQDMIERGMSLREVQRARPTLDYDTEYVNENSFVSTEDFVEAVYQSLAGN